MRQVFVWGITAAVVFATVPLFSSASHGPTHPQWDNLETNVLEGLAISPIEGAREAVYWQLDQVGTYVDARLKPALRQTLLGLNLSEELIAVRDGLYTSELLRGIAAAKDVTDWQMKTLNLDPNTPLPADPNHLLPSDAVEALAARHGVTSVPTEVEELDALPLLVRDELTDVIDAFIVLEIAREDSYANFNQAAWDAFVAEGQEIESAYADGGSAVMTLAESKTDPREPADISADVGINLAKVLKARDAFLDHVNNLDVALATYIPGSKVECDPVEVRLDGPEVELILSIDLDDCDNTYTEDAHLQIDAFGDDTYQNNAGGGSFAVFAAVDFRGYDTYNPGERSGAIGGADDFGVATLVEVRGRDDYILPNNADIVYEGFTGGATDGGVGLMLDIEERDEHFPGKAMATTGGGNNLGVGNLIDVQGIDKFEAGSWRSNGGGALGGIGSLIDLPSLTDDTYAPRFDRTSLAVNGGATWGVGFLYDGGGNERYATHGRVSNGAAEFFGTGLIVESSGSDKYWGGNGGGEYFGAGAHIDLLGDDNYYGREADNTTWLLNGPSNGGARNLSTGLLLDMKDDDNHYGFSLSSNGGGSPTNTHPSLGVLMNVNDFDYYEDAWLEANTPARSCTECTHKNKGYHGAQVDSEG